MMMPVIHRNKKHHPKSTINPIHTLKCCSPHPASREENEEKAQLSNLVKYVWKREEINDEKNPLKVVSLIIVYWVYQNILPLWNYDNVCALNLYVDVACYKYFP